jgi:hypothetical protein
MAWKPPDFSKPSVARAHDALLGGHDNFAADRAAPGSCVVLSCGRCDDEALWEQQLSEAYTAR